MLSTNLIITSGRGDMIHFMEVGIFCIGLNQPDFLCWRLTLTHCFRRSLMMDGRGEWLSFHVQEDIMIMHPVWQTEKF